MFQFWILAPDSWLLFSKHVGRGMIEKIVSGGQTGADQGALEAALKLGIPHGGWVPKGRLTERGPLPDRFRLKEMPTSSYRARTEQNVIDSHGTVIISHGALEGGSELTRKFALEHEKPCLHLDLNRQSAFKSAMELAAWLSENRIRILNVAGPRASKDQKIQKATGQIIKSVYYLSQSRSEEALEDRAGQFIKPMPRSVAEAVERLLDDLPLKDRVTVANMSAGELGGLDKTIGEYIRLNFALKLGNTDLVSSCRFVGRLLSHEADSDNAAEMVVIRELWQRLRKTHKLRVLE
jgi:Circularly permutated YpsA SLOG family